MAVDWENKGCEICRNQWLRGEYPKRIETNEARHTSLHQCDVCGTFWEMHERFADVIEINDVKKYYNFKV